MAKQLAEPKPDDLDRVDLRFYRRLDPRWQDWTAAAVERLVDRYPMYGTSPGPKER